MSHPAKFSFSYLPACDQCGPQGPGPLLLAADSGAGAGRDREDRPERVVDHSHRASSHTGSSVWTT